MIKFQRNCTLKLKTLKHKDLGVADYPFPSRSLLNSHYCVNNIPYLNDEKWTKSVEISDVYPHCVWHSFELKAKFSRPWPLGQVHDL